MYPDKKLLEYEKYKRAMAQFFRATCPGKGEEIALLAKKIQISVENKFDISLDREVNIIWKD